MRTRSEGSLAEPPLLERPLLDTGRPWGSPRLPEPCDIRVDSKCSSLDFSQSTSSIAPASLVPFKITL